MPIGRSYKAILRAALVYFNIEVLTVVASKYQVVSSERSGSLSKPEIPNIRNQPSGILDRFSSFRVKIQFSKNLQKSHFLPGLDRLVPDEKPALVSNIDR